MWKMLLRVLLQNNHHCREKHGWYINFKKFKLEQRFPSISYLHFKEKKKEYVMVI